MKHHVNNNQEKVSMAMLISRKSARENTLMVTKGDVGEMGANRRWGLQVHLF